MRVGGGALLSDRDANWYMLWFIFAPLVTVLCVWTQLTLPIIDAIVAITSFFSFEKIFKNFGKY